MSTAFKNIEVNEMNTRLKRLFKNYDFPFLNFVHVLTLLEIFKASFVGT